jgi:outer membrane protein OmpA-like peptidoglycan-associated protein
MEKIFRKINYSLTVKIVLLLFTQSPVWAKVKSINTNSFNAGMNTTYLSLEDAYLFDQAFIHTKSIKRLYFYGTFTNVNNPWILMNPQGNANVESIISQMQTMDMALGWLISDRTQLSFDTSFSNVKVASDYGGDRKNHWGDSRVQLKYQLSASEDMAVAIAPEIYFPTGVHYVGDTHGGGLSNSSFGFGAKFITEFKFNDHRMSLNAGYSYFENAEVKGEPVGAYPQVDGRSRLFLGAGVLSRLSEKWSWDNELSGNFTTNSNNFTPPGEASTGLRYQMSPFTSWHFGGGSGALRGFGGNDLRLYVGFKTPFSEGKPVAQTQDSRKSEDRYWDKYMEDRKTQPEKGEDILLESDIMPEEKTYTKGFGENNLDLEPVAPIETPLYSDEILPVIPNIENKVIYHREQIEVLEDVRFDLNKATLTPYGKAVLNQVVIVFNKNKEQIDTLSIKGHTDHQGTDKINIPLSAARARTVRDYLIRKGVPRQILSAQGYGAQKPIYDFRKTQKKLWEKNRRVEFVVKEKTEPT